MKAFLIKKTLRPLLFLCLVLFLSQSTKAQFISASLGIHGLTCSLCSYGVEREIDKLDFVEHVQMDLNQNIATVLFEKEKPVQMEELVASVYKAGFSVGYTQALFSFEQIIVEEDLFFNYQGDQYLILEKKEGALTGEHIIRFMDKKYVVPKEYKMWEEKIKLNNKKIPALNGRVNYQIIVL